MLSKKYSKLLRKNILLIFFSIILISILLQYYYLQLIKYYEYSKQAGDNILRRVQVFAPRGIIFDRNNIPLVDNKPLYNLKIISSEIDSSFNYIYLDYLIGKNKFHIDSILNISKNSSGGHLKPILLDRYINDTSNITQY